MYSSKIKTHDFYFNNLKRKKTQSLKYQNCPSSRIRRTHQSIRFEVRILCNAMFYLLIILHNVFNFLPFICFFVSQWFLIHHAKLWLNDGVAFNIYTLSRVDLITLWLCSSTWYVIIHKRSKTWKNQRKKNAPRISRALNRSCFLFAVVSFSHRTTSSN